MRKSHFTTTIRQRSSLLWAICVGSVLLFSFQSKSDQANETAKVPEELTDERLAQFYRDSVFLQIPDGNVDALFLAGKVDDAIYIQALRRWRRSLFIANDTVAWDVKSASTLRISKNMFEHFVEGESLLNKLLLEQPENYEIRKNTVDGGYTVSPKKIPEETGFIKLKK